MARTLLNRGSLLRGAAMLVAAAGIGHFMQTSAMAAKSDDEERQTPTASLASGLPLEPQAAFAPAGLPPAPDLPLARLAAADPAPLRVPGDMARQTPFTPACDGMLAATALRGGQVEVRLAAPCQGAQAVSVQQGALHFSGRTDEAGRLHMVLPALSTLPRVAVVFPGGAVYDAEVPVPEAESYEHVVLMWQGEEGLSLRAIEHGAGYDAAPLASAEAPGQPARGQAYLSQFGDLTREGTARAEVMSLPRDGAAEVLVEAAITGATCGRAVGAELHHLSPAGDASSTLSMTLPPCDQPGGYMVLKNILPDRKVAAN